MKKTLIVGYGNADREDDGAAWYVLAGLARRLGRAVPDPLEENFLPAGEIVDLWFDLQLVPEMSEDFAGYERILFVDAHTGNIPADVLLQAVEGSAASSSFTHHLTPAACLAMTRSIYRQDPEAALLSVRGHQFRFARQLSPQTEALVEQAVEIAWEWIARGE